MDVFEQTIKTFRSGDDLPDSNAEPFLDAMIRSTDESRLSEIFLLWNQKGISENEIYSLAKIMRSRSIKVNSLHEVCVDIVGTGGSRVKTFNVSTAAAFVVAGAGLPVAKHGNKAATSNSGSADVLSALGIEPAVDSATAERCLNEIGICFMYAPNFHRLSPTLGKVRSKLGFPTIFNCVGPLCNPANVSRQLIGVWDVSLVTKMANAVARLGTRKTWIVHGTDGLDEISVSNSTTVAEVEGDRITTFELTPDDLLLTVEHARAAVPAGPAESAKIIQEVLRSRRADSFEEGLVLANAMAAIHISSGARLAESGQIARDSVRNGNALAKMKELAREVSR